MSRSVWYSIFQNIEQANVKTRKRDNLDDKYLNLLGLQILFFASILEVYWPILCCTSLSYLINQTLYMKL